jgi:ATP-dependent Zn protease
LGEQSSDQIDREIKKILDDCGAKAEGILTTSQMREFIEKAMVPTLIESETILRDQWVAQWDAHFA